jgi:uncharacterized membrane-anchored protein
VQVAVKVMPVSKHFIGDYTNDNEFRVQFQNELNQIWVEKDQQLEGFAARKQA